MNRDQVLRTMCRILPASSKTRFVAPSAQGPPGLSLRVHGAGVEGRVSIAAGPALGRGSTFQHRVGVQGISRLFGTSSGNFFKLPP
jgi:hypothetical protein